MHVHKEDYGVFLLAYLSHLLGVEPSMLDFFIGAVFVELVVYVLRKIHLNKD